MNPAPTKSVTLAARAVGKCKQSVERMLSYEFVYLHDRVHRNSSPKKKLPEQIQSLSQQQVSWGRSPSICLLDAGMMEPRDGEARVGSGDSSASQLVRERSNEAAGRAQPAAQEWQWQKEEEEMRASDWSGGGENIKNSPKTSCMQKLLGWICRGMSGELRCQHARANSLSLERIWEENVESTLLFLLSSSWCRGVAKREGWRWENDLGEGEGCWARPQGSGGPPLLPKREEGRGKKGH
jgi:hypothetical protein